jgi:hypothetical protein
VRQHSFWRRRFGHLFGRKAGVVSWSDVLDAQSNWANSIKNISSIYLSGGDYVGAAGHAAGELYGYGHSNVLFKPTKAAKYPFRPTAEAAMSYFVGASGIEGGYDEDAGFAINGGKGWSDVVFKNHQVECCGSTAIAMGSYLFTSASDATETEVEYTFGYRKNEDGKLRIFLHHSSVPYQLPYPVLPAASAPMTEASQKADPAIKDVHSHHLGLMTEAIKEATVAIKDIHSDGPASMADASKEANAAVKDIHSEGPAPMAEASKKTNSMVNDTYLEAGHGAGAIGG